MDIGWYWFILLDYINWYWEVLAHRVASATLHDALASALGGCRSPSWRIHPVNGESKSGYSGLQASASVCKRLQASASVNSLSSCFFLSWFKFIPLPKQKNNWHVASPSLTLWLIKDSNGKSPMDEGFNGRITIHGWFSIAMFDFRRVYILHADSSWYLWLLYQSTSWRPSKILSGRHVPQQVIYHCITIYNVFVTFCLHQMCDHLNSFDAYCQQESLEWCLEQKGEA
jgi:hypothetical protein